MAVDPAASVVSEVSGVVAPTARPKVVVPPALTITLVTGLATPSTVDKNDMPAPAPVDDRVIERESVNGAPYVWEPPSVTGPRPSVVGMLSNNEPSPEIA